MASVCSRSLHQQERTRTLQRRIDLLQVVLPCFETAIARSMSKAKRMSPIRNFWAHLLNPCISMSTAEWPFSLLDDRHADVVKLALEKLEILVSMSEDDIADEFKSLAFPRLETIRKLAKETTKEDLEDIEIEVVKPGMPAGCSELIEILGRLASLMKDDRESPPPEDVRTASRSKPLMAPLLHNLFSTISKYWRCTCKNPHRAALLLFTNRTLPKHNSPACFTVLLSRSMILEPARRWHETGVTISGQLPVSEISVPRIVSPYSRKEERNAVTDLCAVMGKSSTRLNLNIEGSSLSNHADTESQMEKFENCELTTFTEGFLENDSELQIQEKICLAVILSYAFLDFCGKPWFPKGWSKDSLHLMQHDKTLFLHPFLVTNMASQPGEVKLPASVTENRAETLLRHGILLMEVFEQTTLRKTSRPDGKDNSLKHMAQEWFRSIDWGVSERFCQVVRICIQGTLLTGVVVPSTSSRLSSSIPFTNAELSKENFVTLFCERVLAPLEADFLSQWQNKDPDEVMLTIKLPSIKQKSNVLSRPTPVVHVGRFPRQSIPQQSQQNLRPISQRSYRSTPSVIRVLPRALSNTNLRFFDAMDSPDTTQVKGALRWFENFDVDDIYKNLPKRATSKETRIKIAILDTGINMKNTWISQFKGRIQCWPSVTEGDDKDGHGTHVAHLLLRLAPHAHLKIAKVSKSRLLRDADIKQIANAITYFSTGKGRVDIINMSFGFHKYETKLLPILTAIRAARDKGVVIFAAAGNDGGNKRVFWPAALHDGGNLIRVNSSDGNGSPSGFNPDPEVGRKICTLGEGVPSCEPDPKDQSQMLYRSGTSFATPIAAAIAAIVLGFMDNVNPISESDNSEDSTEFQGLKELSPRLRTAAGMERVLCELCVGNSGSKRSGFSYITPWYFLERAEKIRVHLILDILSKVPESPVFN